MEIELLMFSTSHCSVRLQKNIHRGDGFQKAVAQLIAPSEYLGPR